MSTWDSGQSEKAHKVNWHHKVVPGWENWNRCPGWTVAKIGGYDKILMCEDDHPHREYECCPPDRDDITLHEATDCPEGCPGVAPMYRKGMPLRTRQEAIQRVRDDAADQARRDEKHKDWAIGGVNTLVAAMADMELTAAQQEFCDKYLNPPEKPQRGPRQV